MQQWNGPIWEEFLMKCRNENDLEKLKKTLYGIQAGMDLLVRQHLSGQKINEIFASMTRSIETTAKKILRKKYPSLLDEGMVNANDISQQKLESDHANKRKRDLEFQRFLKEARF